MGVSVLHEQNIATPYSPEKDFMLYADTPDYFIELRQGEFVIFYPTDLHMPTIMADEPATVKKVVMKVSSGY